MRSTVVMLLAVVVWLITGCGGGDGDEALRGQTVVVWSNEHQPDRMRATAAILADFTEKTGIRTKLIPIPEDELPRRIARAAGAKQLPDVVLATPAAQSLAYAKEGIFDADAAQEVVERLGEDTFTTKGLALVKQDGEATGVPSDGWGQLLIYRRDMFEKAGLPAPVTLEDIRTAAATLDRAAMAGITLATAPHDGFTAETFEHVALAAGCQLVDDDGDVTFDSPACVDALRWYGDVARNYSVAGEQDVDSTRRRYFAGQAAMVFWSPFLLDAMAGLRRDARPTCPPCRQDPGFLARNSGLVGPLRSAHGGPSQYGSVSTMNITVEARTEAAQSLITYMMSDGYLRWLQLSPQGKFPVRLGDEADPTRFEAGWSTLRSGDAPGSPLSDFYSEASIASLGDGVQTFQRWGFAQGEGALMGALSASQPIAQAVAAVIAGKDPRQVAADTTHRIEEIKRRLE